MLFRTASEMNSSQRHVATHKQNGKFKVNHSWIGLHHSEISKTLNGTHSITVARVGRLSIANMLNDSGNWIKTSYKRREIKCITLIEFDCCLSKRKSENVIIMMFKECSVFECLSVHQHLFNEKQNRIVYDFKRWMLFNQMCVSCIVSVLTR